MPHSPNGIQVIRLPPMSPNLNAHAEHFVRSIKEGCLNRMIVIGQASLRRAMCEFMQHYYAEHNRQGLESRLIRGCPCVAMKPGRAHRRHALGGMLNFDYRKGA